MKLSYGTLRLGLIFALSFLGLLPGRPAEASEPWRAPLEALLNRPEYRHGRWGLLVVDAQTGATIYERNAETLFAPASVTKLFSCGAAWVAFGPDHRFVTPVYQRGTLKPDGELAGDLILVAQGDLTLGGRRGPRGETSFENNDHSYADGTSSDAKLTNTNPLFALQELAKQVKASGIRSIQGEVYIDGRLFEPARGTGSGPAAVSPMIVNDNVIDLVIQPGARVGDPAQVTTRPQTGYLRADFDIVTGKKDSKIDFMELSSLPEDFVLRGSIPLGHDPVVGIIPIQRPLEFARTLWIECLRAEGIRVQAPLVGSPPVQGLPTTQELTKLPRVASYTSEPFAEQLKVTLKVSHNLYASTLPCLLASQVGRRTLKDGLIRQGEILKAGGVDLNQISFSGGSGGSIADHVTPRATVQWLQHLRKRTDWQQFQEALPILGVDGTLATIVPETSPARGHVYAKTGTLSWSDVLNQRSYLTSKALAGSLKTRSGRELLFAIFINDVPLPPGVKTRREGEALGKICEILYEDRSTGR